MGEVIGVWVPLFGVSECAEESLYDVWARGVCLVCARGVVDDAVTVLELPVAEVGGLELCCCVPFNGRVRDRVNVVRRLVWCLRYAVACGQLRELA